MDIEDLNLQGKSCRFCPYYYQRAVQEKSQLILMPYQYILDSTIQHRLELDLKNSIIIFDEAHNIESVAEEGCSLKLSS